MDVKRGPLLWRKNVNYGHLKTKCSGNYFGLKHIYWAI